MDVPPRHANYEIAEYIRGVPVHLIPLIRRFAQPGRCGRCKLAFDNVLTALASACLGHPLKAPFVTDGVHPCCGYDVLDRPDPLTSYSWGCTTALHDFPQFAEFTIDNILYLPSEIVELPGCTPHSREWDPSIVVVRDMNWSTVPSGAYFPTRESARGILVRNYAPHADEHAGSSVAPVNSVEEIHDRLAFPTAEVAEDARGETDLFSYLATGTARADEVPWAPLCIFSVYDAKYALTYRPLE